MYGFYTSKVIFVAHRCARCTRCWMAAARGAPPGEHACTRPWGAARRWRVCKNNNKLTLARELLNRGSCATAGQKSKLPKLFRKCGAPLTTEPLGSLGFGSNAII